MRDDTALDDDCATRSDSVAKNATVMHVDDVQQFVTEQTKAPVSPRPHQVSMIKASKIILINKFDVKRLNKSTSGYLPQHGTPNLPLTETVLD